MTDATEHRVHYEVVRNSDGAVVLEGDSRVFYGPAGPEIRYEGLAKLPVGDYTVHVGPEEFPVLVRPPLELDDA